MPRVANKREFDPEWFIEVLEKRCVSIRSLGNSIGWNEKTIRRALDAGKITVELLDAIAKEINVHPGYLAGDYVWTLDVPIGDEAKKYFRNHYMNPDSYPYSRSEQEKTGVGQYLKTVMLMHGVDWRDFKKLDWREQQNVYDAIDRASTGALRKWFPNAELVSDFEFRESFWQSDADVHEVMWGYYEEHGIVESEESYWARVAATEEPREDPFAAKYEALETFQPQG